MIYQFFNDSIDIGARAMASETHDIATINLSGIKTDIAYSEENDSALNSVIMGHAKTAEPVYMTTNEARLLVACLNVAIDKAEGNH